MKILIKNDDAEKPGTLYWIVTKDNGDVITVSQGRHPNKEAIMKEISAVQGALGKLRVTGP